MRVSQEEIRVAAPASCERNVMETIKINLDEEYDAYERQQRKLSKENTECLNLFLEHLNGLSLNVQRKHCMNVDYFLFTYLSHYESLKMRQGTKKLDNYLGDFFIKKCSWSTPKTIQATAFSIKKFYQCMLIHGKITKKEYDFVCETIKNNLTTWQETCARYNDPRMFFSLMNKKSIYDKKERK